MARLDDIPAGERELIKRMPVPVFDATPFVKGKPLSQRRVSILSTAALQKRDDKVFPEGKPATESFRATLPRKTS